MYSKHSTSRHTHQTTCVCTLYYIPRACALAQHNATWTYMFCTLYYTPYSTRMRVSPTQRKINSNIGNKHTVSITFTRVLVAMYWRWDNDETCGNTGLGYEGVGAHAHVHRYKQPNIHKIYTQNSQKAFKIFNQSYIHII